MVYPGFFKGKEVIESLDLAILKLQPRLESDTYNIAAFCMTIACAAHVFMEANGRVSVALAKYIIDKYSSHSLSFERLQQKNNELVESLSLCIIAMFPQKENIYAPDAPNIINIENYTLEEKKDFIRRFCASIKDHICSFTSHYFTHNKHFNQKLHTLQTLLRDTSL